MRRSGPRRRSAEDEDRDVEGGAWQCGKPGKAVSGCMCERADTHLLNTTTRTSIESTHTTAGLAPRSGSRSSSSSWPLHAHRGKVTRS